MLKKKKILIGLAILTLFLTVSQNSFSQQINGARSGWDVLQNNKPSSKADFVQQLPCAPTKNITKRIYQEGDLENGVLSIGRSFEDFPDEKTISMKLDNSDVQVVLTELAREGGKNIVIDNSVSGTVTTELDNVSINQAMELILAAAELDARVIGDTIFVASRPAMVRKGLNRRVIKSFKLSYANPLDVASILDASIFNKGLDIRSSVQETAKAASEMAVAMQATAQPIPPILDAGGTVINTGDNTPVQTTGQNAGVTAEPLTQGTPPDAAGGIETTQRASGSVASIATRRLRVTDYTVDPANGFNNAGTLAGQIRIQGTKSRTSNYEVQNNSGGPIAVPDTRTNSILIAGVEEDVFAAEKTIRYLDRPLRQVSLEVSLVEMTRLDALELGLALGGNNTVFGSGFNNVNGFPQGPTVVPNAFNPGTGSSAVPGWVPLSANQFAKAVGVPTVLGVGAIQLSTIKNLTSDITARLNFMIRKNKVKLIANPNILAQDGSESLIKLTNQIVNRITVTTTQTTVTASQELADVGIVLNVLPRIAEDGHVTLRVRPSITSPGETRQIEVAGNSNEITLINTREVLIQDVRVKSGETLAIAGLVQETESIDEYKVPIISELPLIGTLFKNTNRNKTKTELIILLTPKIVNDIATRIDPISGALTAPID